MNFFEKKSLVLIVDDDQRQAQMIADVVDSLDFCEALIAHNGKQALDIIRKYSFNLHYKIACVLLDWQMPIMDGQQFLRKLRKTENRLVFRRNLPVIVISAYNDRAKHIIATDKIVGKAAAYLVKPFRAAQLKMLIYEVLVEKEAVKLQESLRRHIELKYRDSFFNS